MKSPIASLSLAAVAAAGWLALPAHADKHTPKSKTPLETCLNAALAKKPGSVVKLETKMEKGKLVYEFDIESADGKAWDIECDTASGKIVEVEEEVKSADDAQFKAKLKVNEADARKTALDKYPGEITEVEYEIEEGGAASYEFDIRTKDGKEMKVEVDATSGKIVEANEELNQIGKE